MTNNPWDSDSKNPWGDNKPQNNNKSNNKPNNIPPDIEQIIENAQKKLKHLFPSNNNWGFGLIASIIAVGWLSTGFYSVNQGQQGVVLQFGKYHKTTQAGLNYHFPYPIQEKILVDVELNRNISIGESANTNIYASDYKKLNDTNFFNDGSLQRTQMLTGDENIVTINFDVRWKVANASDFLFKVHNPQQTVASVSESVMREIVGRNKIDAILTGHRDRIETDVKSEIQKILTDYQAGIEVLQVAIKEAEPPSEVDGAFKDVQAARADSERAIEEATAYANTILPNARGLADKIRQQASAYKESVTADATGETARFEKIYQEYSKAPYVTKKRIYLETIEKILANKDKIIMSNSANKSGILPYLQLDTLSKKPSPNGATQ